MMQEDLGRRHGNYDPLSAPGRIMEDTAPSEVEISIRDAKPCKSATGQRNIQIEGDPMRLTPAQILFLWDEHVKRGEIQVWIDAHGVFHFKADAHPGCTWGKTEAA